MILKSINLAFLIIISINSLFSQDDNSKIRVFVNLGRANSMIKNNYNNLESGYVSSIEKSILGLTTGIGIEYRILNSISIQSGIHLYVPKSKSTIFDNDTSNLNWKYIPRKYDTRTNYKILSIPVEIKYSFHRNNNIQWFLKYGLQTNSIISYSVIVTKTYYDGQISNQISGYDKDRFNKINLSMIGSFGLDYDLDKQYYLGAEIFYNYMFDSIQGREIYGGQRHKLTIYHIGAQVKVGLNFNIK